MKLRRISDFQPQRPDKINIFKTLCLLLW